jgi:hypothetical protein
MLAVLLSRYELRLLQSAPPPPRPAPRAPRGIGAALPRVASVSGPAAGTLPGHCDHARTHNHCPRPPCSVASVSSRLPASPPSAVRVTAATSVPAGIHPSLRARARRPR